MSLMAQMWAFCLIFHCLYSIGQATPREPPRLHPGGRPRNFPRVLFTAPVQTTLPVSKIYGNVSSTSLSTGTSPSSTLTTNNTELAINTPPISAASGYSIQNSTNPMSAVPINPPPYTQSSYSNTSAFSSNSSLNTLLLSTSLSNTSSSVLSFSSNVVVSSLSVGNGTNQSSTHPSGTMIKVSTTKSGTLPFASSGNGTSTVNLKTSSNSTNANVLVSSTAGVSGSLPSASSDNGTSTLNSRISSNSTNVNALVSSTADVSSSNVPQLAITNSSSILYSMTATPNNLSTSSISTSTNSSSLVNANLHSSTVSVSSNSTSFPAVGFTAKSVNVSTSSTIFVSSSYSSTVSSSTATNSSITSSITSSTITGSGQSLSSGGTSTTSSASSSSSTRGSSSGGDGSGLSGLLGAGGLGLGLGLGSDGLGDGLGAGLGSGIVDSSGGDEGDGEEDNKPSISNPTASNSRPSQTATSLTQSLTSGSSTSSNSITSTTSSTLSTSSSSISSSSTTSSTMNSTSVSSTSATSRSVNSTSAVTASTTSYSVNSSSIVTTSTVSRSMNSTSAATSSVTGAYCSVGSCNGAQCNPSSVPVSKREILSIDGRLPTPNDFWRRDLAERNESSAAEYHEEHDIGKRGYIPMLTDLDFANNINNFITEQITFPGAKPCPLPSINPDSTAITVKFDSPPGDGNYFPSLQGLEGCTSVVIIGENGCWLSHFWEVPWFFGFSSHPDAFTQNVITPLENGNGPNMPSPFAAGGQSSRIPELAVGQNSFEPEIHIFTREDNGQIAYPAQVALIQQSLTGPGRAFAGVPVTVAGYVRQDPDSRIAKGKVLVQYTNDQEDDEGNQLVCPQQAIYKLWFEENMVSQHTWPAIGDQLAVPNAKAKIRRSQVCGNSATSSSFLTATSSPTSSLVSAETFLTLETQVDPTAKPSLLSLVIGPSEYPSGFVTKTSPVSEPGGISLVSSYSLVGGKSAAPEPTKSLYVEAFTSSASFKLQPMPTNRVESPDELYK